MAGWVGGTIVQFAPAWEGFEAAERADDVLDGALGEGDLSVTFQCGQDSRLVARHHARIADGIGSKDRRKPAVGARLNYRPSYCVAGEGASPFVGQLSDMTVAGLGEDPGTAAGNYIDLRALALAAALQLQRPDGPRIAVIDDVGYDTHAKQPTDLPSKLSAIDQAMGVVRHSLGEEVWKNTLVLTVTEFGRTVAENGSWGTDHGWATSIFVMGGRLKKSGIVADWPGLKPANLFEGRDLKATIDARALYGSIVSATLGIDPEVVNRDVIAYEKTRLFDPYFY